MLESLLRLLKARTSESFCLGGTLLRRGQFERRAGLARLLFQPAHFVQRFGKKFVELRGKILLRRDHPILRFLNVLVL